MQISDKRVRHGCAKRGSPTRLYQVWQDMKCRCNNPHSKEYKYYGERGISVCEEWNDFCVFQKWAFDNGYNANAKRGECTLDRIDLNKNYEPTNCRWVDAKTQANNRRKWGTATRSHKMITWCFNGEEHTVAEWSEVTGISQNVLRSRYHKGWNIERILTTPTNREGSKNMRIVIDIPKEQYETLNAKSQSEVKVIINTPQLIRAIKNGTPLPEHHGDLKDVDEIVKAIEDRVEFLRENDAIFMRLRKDIDILGCIPKIRCEAPTIIPATKEGGE